MFWFDRVEKYGINIRQTNKNIRKGGEENVERV